MVVGTTSRLVLRYFNRNDREIFKDYRNNKLLNQYQGWTTPFTEDDWQSFFSSINGHDISYEGDWMQIAVESKQTGELIGDIGFHRKSKEVELGITIRPEYQGMGYAKECLDNMIRILIKEFHVHRFVAMIDPENEASIILFKSLNFRQEGYFKQSYWDVDRQEWRDEFLFALLASELELYNK